MAGEQEIIVQDLIHRVHQLMEKYSELKKHNNLLKQENEEFSRLLSEQKEDLNNIEQQYKTAEFATKVLAPIEDKEEAKGQLNRIVREIDNCIALLNR